MSIKQQWAIKDEQGAIINGTVNDSADAAIQVVLDRINKSTYEALTAIGFKLVRVRVSIETISGV